MSLGDNFAAQSFEQKKNAISNYLVPLVGRVSYLVKALRAKHVYFVLS